MKQIRISCEKYEDHINYSHAIITQNQKQVLKFYMRNMKIRETNIIQCEKNENRGHSRIPFENNENHENPGIPN